MFLYLNTHSVIILCVNCLWFWRDYKTIKKSRKSVAFQLQELHGKKPKTPWPVSLHFPRTPLPNTIPDIIVSIVMNRNTGKRLPSLKGFVESLQQLKCPHKWKRGPKQAPPRFDRIQSYSLVNYFQLLPRVAKRKQWLKLRKNICQILVDPRVTFSTLYRTISRAWMWNLEKANEKW